MLNSQSQLETQAEDFFRRIFAEDELELEQTVIDDSIDDTSDEILDTPNEQESDTQSGFHSIALDIMTGKAAPPPPPKVVETNETFYDYDVIPEPEVVFDEPITEPDEVEDPAFAQEESQEEAQEEIQVSVLEEPKPSKIQSVVTEPTKLELPVPIKPTVETIAPGKQLIQVSSLDKDQISGELVDQLFDRMSCMFSEREDAVVNTAKTGMEELAKMNHKLLLVETRNEVTSVVRSELPKLMTSEIRAVFKAEMLNIVRTEVVQTMRTEFGPLRDLIDAVLKKISAIEPRLAVIEGAVGREIAINFPKGGFHVEVPVTVPEREVKIAAPINVQPATVVFDDGAVNIHLHKDGSKGKTKKIIFHRDGYDRVVDAEIVG